MPNVALIDLKHVDGEPWEVAGVAGEQFQDALALCREAFEGLEWAARNAWLSQEEHRTGAMPAVADFEESPLGRKLAAIAAAVDHIEQTTASTTMAAAWDPRGH